MRVVVLGATGNVGTSVVDALAADPQVTSILGVARRPTSWQPAKTEIVTADIASDDLVPHLRGADAVVHLAWLFQPTHHSQLTWRVNAVGSGRVFDAVAEAGVPALVHASSVGAYSPGPKDRFVDESWPTHGWPTAGYTREKAYVERLLDAFEARHPQVRVVRLRPGFIFKRESASEQRRLFGGPLVPGWLVRPGLLPVLPDVPGLRFQALHSADAAEAYRLAVTGDARGAFNLAADPVLDVPTLAELFGARTVRVPARLLRAPLALAWALHLVPASPQLLDAVLRVPLLDTTRARNELGWQPRHSAVEALQELLGGLQAGAGADTAPLEPDAGHATRVRELRTGVGSRP